MVFDISGTVRHSSHMDNREYGRRLKAAMAARGLSRRDVAEVLQVKERTITNYTSGATHVKAHDRELLAQLLGPFGEDGDEVERAVRRSRLLEWRQDHVIGEYKRHLHEQESLKGVKEA